MQHSAKRLCSRVCILALTLVVGVAGGPARADSSAPIDLAIRLASQRFDADAAQRLQAWRELLTQVPGLPIEQQLERVNSFFNAIPFQEDERHWGRSDYWATPIELLSSGGGDCEDYAIAKYFTLRQLGIPSGQLRITYVRALTRNQAHMVLAYYDEPDAEPLVLDNIDPRVRPASEREDLQPVYGFNGDSIWLLSRLRGRGDRVGGANRIGRWQQLVTRMETAAGPSFRR